MILSDIDIQQIGDRVRLTGTFENAASRCFDMWFEYPAQYTPYLRNNGDAFVAAAVPPLMQRGEDLDIKVPVSHDLSFSVTAVQEVLRSFYPTRLKRINVHCGDTVDSTHAAEAVSSVGCFFSLGVDSLYSVLKRRHGIECTTPDITHLVYMHGFEDPLSVERDTDSTERAITSAAEKLGLPCIVGSTNLRDCFGLQWGPFYNGSGLAAAGLSLGGGFRYVIVPSSYEFTLLHPWGSHPVLETRWSCGALGIVHDGAEAFRSEKIGRVIVPDTVAMEHVRVCIASRGGADNCAECSKCLRTIVVLDGLGALSRTPRFPHLLPDDIEARYKIKSESEYIFAVDAVEGLRRLGGKAETIAMLARKIRQYERRQAFAQLVRGTPVERAAALKGRVGRAVRRRVCPNTA